MINILLLMSGSGQPFKDAGYLYPKNLVEIGGQPLVQRVLDHLGPLRALGARFLCVLRRDENRAYHTGTVIQLIDSTARLIELNAETSGAACSALMAVSDIDNDDPLVIVNGDQLLLQVDLPAVIRDFQNRALDGGVLVFEDIHPRWSFVKCDDRGHVVETAEKRPISNLATAGFYYFTKGRDFVLAATEMIKKDAHVGGLFYICPAFNELILRQRIIGVHRIPRRSYRSLASPADVEAFTASNGERQQPDSVFLSPVAASASEWAQPAPSAS
jgi:dTDP-glucose pyrophosphorylase